MTKVVVVTDSVACLPKELIDEFDIHIIPVRLTIAGKVYQDTSEDLPQELVNRFQEAPQIDTTPWPPEFYLQEYKELARNTNNIVHIVCFSQFTSTISLARVAAKMAQEAIPGLKVEIVDSETATMAQGFIVLAAARAAAANKDMDAVIAAANKVKARANSIWMLDSLAPLARTGRINKLAAWASSFLNVKPIVALSHGAAHPVSLVRSKLQGINRMLKLIHDDIDVKEPLHAAVMQAGESRGEELVSMIRDQFHPIELYLTQFTPVMQVTAGSGILGVAFYCGE